MTGWRSFHGLSKKTFCPIARLNFEDQMPEKSRNFSSRELLCPPQTPICGSRSLPADNENFPFKACSFCIPLQCDCLFESPSCCHLLVRFCAVRIARNGSSSQYFSLNNLQLVPIHHGKHDPSRGCRGHMVRLLIPNASSHVKWKDVNALKRFAAIQVRLQSWQYDCASAFHPFLFYPCGCASFSEPNGGDSRSVDQSWDSHTALIMAPWCMFKSYIWSSVPWFSHRSYEPLEDLSKQTASRRMSVFWSNTRWPKSNENVARCLLVHEIAEL